ncbi:hypothetical protein FM106_13150 [Brachybacterium faecium]|nr:hypothetical protein FM106_13150 [Brachybacterium faecium]
MSPLTSVIKIIVGTRLYVSHFINNTIHFHFSQTTVILKVS